MEVLKLDNCYLRGLQSLGGSAVHAHLGPVDGRRVEMPRYLSLGTQRFQKHLCTSRDFVSLKLHADLRA